MQMSAGRVLDVAQDLRRRQVIHVEERVDGREALEEGAEVCVRVRDVVSAAHLPDGVHGQLRRAHVQHPAAQARGQDGTCAATQLSGFKGLGVETLITATDGERVQGYMVFAQSACKIGACSATD